MWSDMDQAKLRSLATGSDVGGMTRLLCDTRASEWQTSLRKLLMSYYQHDVMNQAVNFLRDNIHRAIEAIKTPESFPGFPCIYIHTEDKPAIFDLDLWKGILLGLNFELTEPEGNRHLDLIEVKVTGKVTLTLLQGFYKLLCNISNLSQENMRLVLYMGDSEQIQLVHVLQQLQHNQEEICNRSLVSSLYERQPGPMQSLGFYKEKKGGGGKVVKWERERAGSGQLDSVVVVLFGLYHDGVGLETYV